MKTFIVRFWETVFRFLGWVSLFIAVRYVVRRWLKSLVAESPGFVEAWVLGHAVLSVLLLIHAPQIRTWNPLLVLVFVFGTVRLYEMIIYLINVVLFDELRRPRNYALEGYRRSIILLAHNYVEVVVWFALFYRLLGWAFDARVMDTQDLVVALRASFAAMTSLGPQAVPLDTLGSCVLLAQSVLGLLMAILFLARFISFLPKPKSKDPAEVEKAP